MTGLPKTKTQLTPEEYLGIEREAETKSEYYAGEMFAMAGASREHNLITANVLAGIHRCFAGRSCEVYQSDMRVKVSATGLYTYPDVIAVCGEARFEDEEQDTLLNPLVLVEVLSESTEGYDRGTKSEHYRRIESLSEYVLIAQDKYHVEHFVRQADSTWLLWETDDSAAVLELRAIQCELTVAEIYDKVDISGGRDPQSWREA